MMTTTAWSREVTKGNGVHGKGGWYKDKLESILVQLPFPGSGARKLVGSPYPNRINLQAYGYRCSFHQGVFQGIESMRNEKYTGSDSCLSRVSDGSEEVQIRWVEVF